jgi:hypothetical protein
VECEAAKASQIYTRSESFFISLIVCVDTRITNGKCDTRTSPKTITIVTRDILYFQTLKTDAFELEDIWFAEFDTGTQSFFK